MDVVVPKKNKEKGKKYLGDQKSVFQILTTLQGLGLEMFQIL